MRSTFRLGLVGLALGFALSFIGFSRYDEVRSMFLFEDLRLLLTFLGAVVLSAVVFALSKVPKSQEPFTKGLLPGGLLFGAGWALTGACPSIALVQLGEGYLPALFTVLGIVVGVWLHQKVRARLPGWTSGGCGE